MGYKCNKCKCIFTTNKSLKYHIKNNVCTKIKKMFSCMFCPKSYKYNNGLLKHLNNKHLNKIKQNNKQNNLECKLCNTIFSRTDNLKRHMKTSCIKKNNYFDEIKTNNNNRINIIGDNNIINNTTNNNNNNITNNNITINNFGKEDISSISDKIIYKCVNMCFEAIPALFKIIHIDIPENRNLYLTNIKNPFIYTYINDKWSMCDIKHIINDLQKYKKDIIEEYFENNKNKFRDYKINNINKMLEKHKNGELDKRYNNSLKLLLINNKKKLKNIYKKTKK